MTFYDCSINYIDRRFRRLLATTSFSVEQIFTIIEKSLPAEVTEANAPSRDAFSRALRTYKSVAVKAYAERSNQRGEVSHQVRRDLDSPSSDLIQNQCDSLLFHRCLPSLIN